MKVIFLSILFCIAAFTAYSQDIIYRQNGEKIEAKILEVGTSELKYKLFNNQDGPLYVLDLDRIKRIVFENGTEQNFSQSSPIGDSELYAEDRKKAIKFNFLSPLYGYTEFSYEQVIKPGRGFEISLGMIGAGKTPTHSYYDGSQMQSTNLSPRGILLSAGLKFSRKPTFFDGRSTKHSHIMQGAYIKPIIYFSNYSEKTFVQEGERQNIARQNVTAGTLQIELGKQWVFSDGFLMDIYFGGGYTVDNKIDKEINSGNEDREVGASHYYAFRAGKNPGFSFTFGLKIGLPLK